MNIFLPRRHAQQILDIIARTVGKYVGEVRTYETLYFFEQELISEVYKYLYMENDLTHFKAIKSDLLQITRLVDPLHPAEELRILPIEENL